MRLNVQIDSLIAGAERTVGVAVIIDVFRAFTTAAVALANGATKIVMVRDVEEALQLRALGVGDLCMGEVGGRAPPGFDLGNSPFEASGADLEGRTIIQRTSAGTQGIVAAKQATRLYAGSLLTAESSLRSAMGLGCVQTDGIVVDNGCRPRVPSSNSRPRWIRGALSRSWTHFPAFWRHGWLQSGSVCRRCSSPV
jgi:phosphosulfolactate phosphohydrolase-like enzyme